MIDAIDRKKTIERIKTDLSKYIYDDWGNITALGTQLIYIIGCMPSFVPCEDYISREEMLKDIKSQAERGGMTPSDEIAKSIIDVFIRWVNDFPSVEVRLERQWIPCNELLPEYNQRVLVLEDYDYVFIAKRVKAEDNRLKEESWLDDDGYPFAFSNCHVIKWMPLPDPYDGEVDG